MDKMDGLSLNLEKQNIDKIDPSYIVVGKNKVAIFG